MASLHENGKLSDIQKQAKAKELRKAAEGDLGKVLNAGQMRKLEEMGGTARLLDTHALQLHHVLSQLDLSDDQKQALHQIFVETHQGAAHIDGNPTLNEEQKKHHLGELHRSTMEKVHEILNSAQREKFGKLMKPRHGGL